MNIIKEMLNLPDTPSGKKKLNKLITKLGLGKKQKGDILKNVVSGDIGGVASKDEYIYYKVIDSPLFGQLLEPIILVSPISKIKAQPYNENEDLINFIYYGAGTSNMFKHGSKILGLRYSASHYEEGGIKMFMDSLETVIKISNIEQELPGISNSFQRCSKDEFYNINI